MEISFYNIFCIQECQNDKESDKRQPRHKGLENSTPGKSVTCVMKNFVISSYFNNGTIHRWYVQ